MPFECSECGTEVSESDEFCPKCGTQFASAQSSNAGTYTESKSVLSKLSEKQYLAIGGISGLVSFVFLPIIFGPVSILCGQQLYTQFNKRLGGAVAALGVIGMLVGMFVGAVMTA